MKRKKKLRIIKIILGIGWISVIISFLISAIFFDLAYMAYWASCVISMICYGIAYYIADKKPTLPEAYEQDRQP